jgi:hypothetical protein
MAAGTAPALDPNNNKNENEQTHLAKPDSFKEWLVAKLDKIFRHNHEHDTYFGM